MYGQRCVQKAIQRGIYKTSALWIGVRWLFLTFYSNSNWSTLYSTLYSFPVFLLCFLGNISCTKAFPFFSFVSGIFLWWWWNFSILSYSWRQSRALCLDTQLWRMRGTFPLLFFMSHSGKASVYYFGLLPVSGLLVRVSSYSLVKLLTIRRGHVLEVRALRPALIIKLKKEFTLHSFAKTFHTLAEAVSHGDMTTWFRDCRHMRDCIQAMGEAQLLSSSHWFYIQNWLDKQRIHTYFTYSSVSLVLRCTVMNALAFATPSTFLATHMYRPSSSFFTLSMIRTPSSHRVIPATKRSQSCFTLTFCNHVRCALLHTGQVSKMHHKYSSAEEF